MSFQTKEQGEGVQDINAKNSDNKHVFSDKNQGVGVQDKNIKNSNKSMCFWTK